MTPGCITQRQQTGAKTDQAQWFAELETKLEQGTTIDDIDRSIVEIGTQVRIHPLNGSGAVETFKMMMSQMPRINELEPNAHLVFVHEPRIEQSELLRVVHDKVKDSGEILERERAQ